MSDELKELFAKFFSRELDELRRNKTRTIALAVCVVGSAIAYVVLNDDGEEIDLNDTPPVTKDLPAKDLPAKNSSDKKISAQVSESPDGVKIVLGATTDELLIADPFQGKEKPPPPKKVEPPTIPPPVPPLPQPIQQQPPPKVEPKEKIILTGTAVSGDNKVAMFLRGKENFFGTIGDEVGGRIISDITPDFVTFTDGKRVYIQKELD